jgi:hypothetical protein
VVAVQAAVKVIQVLIGGGGGAGGMRCSVTANSGGGVAALESDFDCK